jgi:hypothetical protein
MSETTRRGGRPVFFAATAYRTRFALGKKRKLPRLNRVTRRVPENLREAGMNVRTVDSRAPPYRLGLDLTQDLFSSLAK